MTKQDILDRIQNVLYQNVDTESQDLDLLRHDLELEIIKESKNGWVYDNRYNSLYRIIYSRKNSRRHNR